MTVKIADMEGRVVYNNTFGGANNKLQVITNDLAPGTYTASIMVGTNVVNQKITITK